MLEREKPRRDVDDRPLDLEWHIRTTAGMMGVIPIWRVWEIVDGPEMKVIREAFADGLQSFLPVQRVSERVDS